MNKDSLDFLAVGDLATDVFIKIKDAKVSCEMDSENCLLCMRFGDKIPFESATEVKAVGNSPNAAVSASRLGLSSALISHVGDDRHGQEDLAELLKNGISTKYVKTQKGKSSNYHYVLWYEAERTILIKHEHFDYQWEKPNINPRWLYLSSLGEGTEKYHEDISEYLSKNPEVKLVFQPGTYQLKMGLDKLSDIYKRSEFFICNTEEARKLLTDRNLPKNTSVYDLLTALRAEGPKIVITTDGPKGAYMFDGDKKIFQPPYPDEKPPFERTGAGDAFASTFASFLALGLSPQEALMRAPINSMSVVQHVGAQAGLLTREKIEEYLAKAPENYKQIVAK